MIAAPFDGSNYRRIDEARKAFLQTFFPDLISSLNICTALDVGCGFGFFSQYLSESGLHVVASDARAENVEEAKRRNPSMEVLQVDIEDPTIVLMRKFDLVFCFGLLYHLENPLRAIRNLASLTKKVLLIESRIAPASSVGAYLYQEGYGQDQGLTGIALIPTERCFIKCLYEAGFSSVYKTVTFPDHEEFRSSFRWKRRRTILIASKVELSLPILKKVSEPNTDQYIWHTFPKMVLCLRNYLFKRG